MRFWSLACLLTVLQYTVEGIGNCESLWKHIWSQRVCIKYINSALTLTEAGAFCKTHNSELWKVKTIQQLKLVLKTYSSTELSSLQLPYYLLGDDTIVDLKGAAVYDCDICNELVSGYAYSSNSSATRRCIIASGSEEGLKLEGKQCQPTGHLCSKPDG